MRNSGEIEVRISSATKVDQIKYWILQIEYEAYQEVVGRIAFGTCMLA